MNMNRQPTLVALFGERVKQLGLTHWEVDERAGLSQGHFSKIMCGLRKPALQTIERLCDASNIAFVVVDGRSSIEGES
jgi:predicted transcriptional regulator